MKMRYNMEDSNRNFKLQTCEDFIEVLASKAAVPGGGGSGHRHAHTVPGTERRPSFYRREF